MRFLGRYMAMPTVRSCLATCPRFTDGALASGTGWIAGRNDAFDSINFSPLRLKVSTSNPRSGSYHLRSENASTNGLFPWIEHCDPSPSVFVPFAALVEPGDYVRFGFHIATSVPIQLFRSLVDGRRADLLWYDSNMTLVGGSLGGASEQFFSPGYTYLETDGVAPAGAYYVVARTSFLSGSDDFPGIVDIDDAILEVVLAAP